MASATLDSRSLFSADGISWHDGDRIEWPLKERDETVVKLVIGEDPSVGEESSGKDLIALTLPNLASVYPNLTHLHLWYCAITELSHLPPGLQCLDLRGCRELKSIGGAGLHQLEELLLDGCSRLSSIDVSDQCNLISVSLKQCTQIPEAKILNWLRSDSSIQYFDASDCSQLVEVKALPNGLMDLRLNRCKRLVVITEENQLPNALRRLELRHAESLVWLPHFHAHLDYVDLAYTSKLRTLPDLHPFPPGTPMINRRPRTLILFESGIEEDRELLGEEESTNVAERVHADRDEPVNQPRQPDHELKLILLGNGRSGKSSFARRWVEDKFDEKEKTTHGVLLWEKEDLRFVPDGETRPTYAKLNIWDFAGQDLYHSTHRIFLQSKAIFLVFTTEHPPGADEETDERERAAIQKEGEDADHPVEYWIEQIASLGRIPGQNRTPPYLVIQSKCDRGEQRSIEGSVSFSAKEGSGIDQIQGWIETQIPQLLGKQRQRSVPAAVIEVKKELSHKRDNEPKISRAAFDEIVRSITSDSLYGQRPELLLERLHRSGFLYYDAYYLPDDVILDQRWVIEGIYCLTSRLEADNCRELLFRNQGRFTASLLRPYWETKEYTRDQQALFLRFMTSCGMAYVVRNAEDTVRGEAEYIAPGFLREKSDFDATVTTIPEGAEHYEVADISEADIIAILAGLGKEWKRDLRAWRWGCRFQAADTKTSCVLDWQNQKNDPSKYHWPLKIGFSETSDPAFVRYVQQVLRDSIGHRAGLRDDWTVKSQGTSSAVDSQSIVLANESIRQDRAKEAFLPDPKKIRIAFSFAGSDNQNPGIDEIPKSLAKKLRNWIDKTGFPGEVIAYGMADEEERLAEFIDELCDGDLALIFWSKKYFDSKFCLREMQLFYEKEPRGRLYRKNVLVFVIDGKKLRTDKEIHHADWETTWTTKGNERFDEVYKKKNGDKSRTDTALRRDPLHPWYELVLNEKEFDEFIRSLLNYRFARDLSEQPMDSAALLDFVTNHLLDPYALLTMANQQLARGHVQQAASLYSHALARWTQGMSQDQGRAEQLMGEKTKFESALRKQDAAMYRALCE